MALAYRTRDPISTDRQNVRAKFEVEEVGEYTRMQRIGKRATDGITKGLIFEDVRITVPRAWIVYFPSGHSVRVESEEEMVRLGYLAAPPMVDMETGEEVPMDMPLTPKQAVERATKPRRSAM